MLNWYGLNRTYCDVLQDMRNIIKAGKPNCNLLLSLVEELQVYGNRMEAGLGDVRDLDQLHNDIKKKQKKLEKLREEVKDG